jgi:hypothetical protein
VTGRLCHARAGRIDTGGFSNACVIEFVYVCVATRTR